ncbi:MAG: DNA methyltransferase [Phycisphaerales bacterium JB037]
MSEGTPESGRPRPGPPSGRGHRPGGRPGPGGKPSGDRRGGFGKPPLRVFTSTLWEYPSQHYDAGPGSKIQGDPNYTGATPSWVIWQLLKRYTREGDTILDPMCGSGTTLDVCRDLGRTGVGFDLAPSRPDITPADARELPLDSGSVDFAFIDPPYSTHVDYSDHPDCIGRLDAGEPPSEEGEITGQAYYEAMEETIAELHRVLRNRRYMALYVSDSWKKRRGEPGGGAGQFMPIGFELFSILRDYFEPIDIIAVVRHNAKLKKGNWHKAAEEGNYFLRGFNYLFIMKKVEGR